MNNEIPNSSKPQGFTLIELLVVLSILGIIIGLTLFGVSGARESSRDAKRKADLELIRSGIEVYRADCNKYPLGEGDVLTILGTSLSGDGSLSSCPVANTYIGEVPVDPRDPNSVYRYYSDGIVYQICAALEQGSGSAVACGSSTSCGPQSNCNYRVINP